MKATRPLTGALPIARLGREAKTAVGKWSQWLGLRGVDGECLVDGAEGEGETEESVALQLTGAWNEKTAASSAVLVTVVLTTESLTLA